MVSDADKCHQPPADGAVAEVPAEPPAVTPTDVYRYRYQHGVNLGGIFVLERWLFGSMFDGCQGDSELDAVQASLAARGFDATIAKWKAHWRSALTDADFAFLDAARVTLVRLPIGHFTLGPAYCANTPFDGSPAQMYCHAWEHVLDVCARLHAAGIGVLLDLHALPGGANDQGHSGTGSGKADLWGSRANRMLARDCAVFLAREVAAGKVPSCAGIELCNEAVWAAKDMYAFYADCIAAIADVDASIPIYVSDAWNLAEAVKWAAKHNAAFAPRNPAVVDTHAYYTFTEADRSCSPAQILDRIPNEFARSLHGAEDVIISGAAPVFVGEYACVLDGRTWSRVPPSEREGLVRQFGQAQMKRAHVQCLGAAFWTLKMEWMDGGEWGFVEMTKKGAVGAPPELGSPRPPDGPGEDRGARSQALADAGDRCKREFPRKSWSARLFEAGFDVGWQDAVAFFTAPGSLVPSHGKAAGANRIGSRDAWVLKRLRDVGPNTGVWEWERGCRYGLEVAEQRLFVP